MFGRIKKKKNKKNKKNKKTKSIWYNGIIGVKRSNVRIDLSEAQEAEIEKCACDPIYFIEKYVKVKVSDKGIINIKLREYQKDFIKRMLKDRFLIAKGDATQPKGSTSDENTATGGIIR